MPWRWLAIVSFAITFATSVGAFFSARNWVADGKYLQAIDIEQIEVLRLIPALKDLQSQTIGPFTLEPSFFNNLKKSDGFFKSITDDVKIPTDAVSVSKPANMPGKLPGASKEASVGGDQRAILSDNALLAFFQRLDAKAMSMVFGKPDKYAYLSEEKTEEKATPAVEQKKSNIDSVQDVLYSAKRVGQSISVVLSQEKSLAGLGILAKSADTLVGPKGVLELDKTAIESPTRKYAESLEAFIKANDAWQKSITDPAATAELQKTLATVIDQKVLLEIEASKKVTGKVIPKLAESITKLHQSAWHTKLPQESALTLKLYAGGMQTIREFASDYEALRLVAQKNSQDLGLFDFKTAGGFLGLTVLSLLGLIGIAAGGLLLLRNMNLNAIDLQRSTKVVSAADELLDSIDLSLANAPSVKAMEPKKIEPNLPAAASKAEQSSAELNTVVNVISELSSELKEKIGGIERRFKLLGQLSNKLRHSVTTLQDKSKQIRSTGDNGDNEESYTALSERANRISPLDQLQDAFFALKQQGVRLYLAILDNHSSKQLAVETEQLNLLVDRVEATVSKMRSSLASALDQAAASEQAAPEISMEVIELLTMDAKQVMRDLDLWQDEFEGLGQEFADLKRQAKA